MHLLNNIKIDAISCVCETGNKVPESNLKYLLNAILFINSSIVFLHFVTIIDSKIPI